MYVKYRIIATERNIQHWIRVCDIHRRCHRCCLITIRQTITGVKDQKWNIVWKYTIGSFLWDEPDNKQVLQWILKKVYTPLLKPLTLRCKEPGLIMSELFPPWCGITMNNNKKSKHQIKKLYKKMENTISRLHKYAHPPKLRNVALFRINQSHWISCLYVIIIQLPSIIWFWLAPDKDQLLL